MVIIAQASFSIDFCSRYFRTGVTAEETIFCLRSIILRWKKKAKISLVQLRNTVLNQLVYRLLVYLNSTYINFTWSHLCAGTVIRLVPPGFAWLAMFTRACVRLGPACASFCINTVTCRLCVNFRNTSVALNRIPTGRLVTCEDRSCFTITRNYSNSTMVDKVEEEYGSWPSPITSAMLTEGISLVELKLDPSDRGKGVVYWSELRYNEGGRCVICSKFVGGKLLEWTPPEFNVRTSVHEYGGGAFLVYNGIVYFSNYKDQRIYKQEAFNQPPTPITPADSGWRYADGDFYDGKIYCVREEHGTKGSSESGEPKNSIVSINVATHDQRVIAEEADFYSSPKVSPDGKNLIWMQWNHPNMPWDDTEIWMANLLPNGDMMPGSERKILGMPNVNFMQPRFSPSNSIFFISDQTNWWNLYQYNDSGQHHNVQSLEKELGGPHWVFGNSGYTFDPVNTSDVACSFNGELAVINLKSELYYKQETGFTNHQYLAFGRDNCVYCIASSPLRFPSIIRWNVVTGETEVMRESREPLDEAYITIPQHLAFPTGGNGQKAYGYFYAPKNGRCKGKPNTLPPLVVMAHGGPTAQASTALDLRKQYLTSRGFAVLDVNYRGSTGYGKLFRQALQYGVGITDVDDVCNGATFLANEQKVDKTKLCITGRSAGGYVVLAALTFKSVFQVGVSHFGIGDLELLEKETHKFESRYNHFLIGPYPEAIDEYRRRSPLHSIEKLSCPVAFFQGDADKIVPKNQAEMMYDALKVKGLPTALTIFEGEGHGFRVGQNIELSIDGEYYFFGRVLGISCIEPKNIEKMNIVNLSTGTRA